MPMRRAFLAVARPRRRAPRLAVARLGGALVRPSRGSADVDRLRRRLGVVLARALRAARRRRRNRWHGARGRGPGGGSRDRALGHVPAQAGGDAVRPRRSGADGEARRRALRLRRLGLGLPDAADRAERAVGSLASDPAHADRRALPGERPALRHAACGAGRTAGAPRLERAVHGRRRCGVVESRSARSPTSSSRTTRTRISSGATGRSTARVDFVCATASRVAKLLAVGIPPSRIGIMIGFQTGRRARADAKG